MKHLILTITLCSLSSVANAFERENFYNKKYCAELGGIYSSYHNNTGATNASIDCETEDTAWEGEWSYKAYEAVGQSLWYASITGKTPGIIFYVKKKNQQKYIDRAKLTFDSLNIKYRIKVINLLEQ
jgi:hypothetical protein